MKSVLISIQPKWCELIASGKKTVEVRKTRPKLETPFKCYIYCTQARMPIRDDDGRILLYEDDLAITNRYGQGKRVENPHGTMKDGEVFLNGKVIGEFVCDRIGYVRNYGDCVDMYDCYASCLSEKEIIEYATDKNGNFVYTYGWHISDLVIYDKPRELSEFKGFCDGISGKIGCRGCEYYYTESNESVGFYEECGCDNLRPLKRPPQSWRYVEGE